MSETEVWITGVGLLSCLGEGEEAHVRALSASPPPMNLEREKFAPYVVHPVAPFNIDSQIPRRGDQRQMLPFQHIGTYAAGLALTDAGIAGKPEFLSRTDLLVACGGNDRDVAVDSAILEGLRETNDPDAYLNQHLMSDLRPTLFLGQLPNLLAGNISIVHKVTGSTRTFMGEEGAGLGAIGVAAWRIAAGQGDIFLVGGASGVERKDLLFNVELGGFLWKGEPKPVWDRPAEGGGIVLGSVGAFLVLESRAHAEARGAKPYARIRKVITDRSTREPGAARAAGDKQIAAIEPLLTGANVGVLSGATGAAIPTSEERGLLEDLAAQGKIGPVRGVATILGSGLEADFPALIALSAIALRRGEFYAPFAEGGFEKPATTAPERILATSWGHWRGEGIGVVERIN
jgi:3-oxoacyl-[acyl-carrier-protein] synthase II